MYDTYLLMSTFVEVMQRKPWPLFLRTRCNQVINLSSDVCCGQCVCWTYHSSSMARAAYETLTWAESTTGSMWLTSWLMWCHHQSTSPLTALTSPLSATVRHFQHMHWHWYVQQVAGTAGKPRFLENVFRFLGFSTAIFLFKNSIEHMAK